MQLWLARAPAVELLLPNWRRRGCALRFLIVAGISRRQTSTMTSSQPRRHRGIVMGDALAQTSRKFNPIGRTRGLLHAKCLPVMVIFLSLAGALVGERSLIRAFRGDFTQRHSA